MSFAAPDTPPLPVVPGAPTPPPVFGERAGQKKKPQQSMQPTFLGTQATPQAGQVGSKTLLGQ